MTKHQLPPVPPAGRTGYVPGEDRHRRPDDKDDAKASAGDADTGRQKNVAVNTTNKGHQQDR